MKILLAALYFITGIASAASITVTYPDACTISGPANAQIIACPSGGTPPPACPAGSNGTPPNCVCIPPTTGTPPNCVTPPPPPPGAISCTGFNHTTVINENWANPQTNVVARMGVNDAIVVTFTTGTKTSTGINRISMGEWQSPPSSRYGTLSAQPCDFGSGLSVSYGSSINFYFSVGMPDPYGDPILKPSTTYYANIRNDPNNPNCASNGICDMFVSLYKGAGQ